MVTRWVFRLFDDRYAWLRMTLLGLSGIGYLLLRPYPDEPYAPVDWAFAAAALSLCPLGVRWPLASALGSALVFGLAGWFGEAAPTVPQVGATWGVLELTLRRPIRQVAVTAAAVLAACLVDSLDHLPATWPTWLYGVAVTVGVPVLIGLNIRASRQLARQAEQRVAIEAEAARASERAAIARELHDLVAHHVASMVLRVGVARHVLRDTDPRVTEVFDDLHDSGTNALADLRRLVAVLRDPATVGTGPGYVPIEPGALPEALATTVDRAVRTGLTVDASIDPAVATLDTVRGLTILRLTQEGLANVAKHAGPTARARVRVRVLDDAVHWELTDDGAASHRGARRSESGSGTAGSGHGLVGMRERVELLGGTFTAGPEGAGWRVRTVLPMAVSR
ncbi:sensor histidine kinase [Micromonospora sp. HM5-17]|uniref:sensor histidine kinase n=1 Tax=Micromonospora sp. HM5-17 TaxID=2487710 RepID=UPI001F367CDB|nr:histidine kinase [Micromonospora sp. HM5-17]